MPNHLRIGHASTLGQKEAQDNPPAEAGGGGRLWAVGRPARSAEWAHRPHRLNFSMCRLHTSPLRQFAVEDLQKHRGSVL